MDNDYALNIDEIIRTIKTAEVVTFRFMLLEKRLPRHARSVEAWQSVIL